MITDTWYDDGGCVYALRDGVPGLVLTGETEAWTGPGLCGITRVPLQGMAWERVEAQEFEQAIPAFAEGGIFAPLPTDAGSLMAARLLVDSGEGGNRAYYAQRLLQEVGK